MSSLRDIEKTISTFWTNSDARQWLAAGADPATAPDVVKGIDQEVLKAADHKGVALYGRMINYGHHDVMDSIFPYCSKLLGKEWEDVVEEYLLRYPPDHYNLNRICRHFSEFLVKYGQKHLAVYPFLDELADYEWMELEKIQDSSSIARGDATAITTPEQILTLAPILNSTLIIRRYRYPIAEIAVRMEGGRKVRRKMPPKETFVAIFRDPESHRIRFLELGRAAAALVKAVQEEGADYQSLLKLAVSLTPELSPDQAVLDFLQLIEDLQTAFLFTGSQRKD